MERSDRRLDDESVDFDVVESDSVKRQLSFRATSESRLSAALSVFPINLPVFLWHVSFLWPGSSCKSCQCGAGPVLPANPVSAVLV